MRLRIRKLKYFSFAIVSSILALTVLFVIGEILVRLFIPRGYWEYRDLSSDWQPDFELGWVNKPNLDVTTRDVLTSEFIRFQTNQDGLTPGEAKREKRPGVLRILMFGDSFVLGRDIVPDKNVHVFLERILRSHGFSVEVMNAGVQGYSTDQTLLLMHRIIPLYHPDIVAYCISENDFGGNASQIAYSIPKPVFLLKPDGALKEILPDVRNVRIGLPHSRLKELIQFSALYRYLYPGILKLRSRFMRWEEKNLLFGLNREIYFRRGEGEKLDWRLMFALIKRMDEVARQNKAHFFFYNHPSINEVWDPYIRDVEQRLSLKPGEYDRYAVERQLIELSREYSLSFCPVIGYFVKNESRGPFHLLPRDHHCNGTGYEVTAERLATFIEMPGFLEGRKQK